MGYLDYIALQCTPATATDEFLEAWGALKNVNREAISQASGAVTFSGSNGTNIPAGTLLNRGDGLQFITNLSETVLNSSVTISAIAIPDPTGLTGSNGNSTPNTQFTLANSIAGISSTSTSSSAFTGGSDIEIDSSLRTRILLAYQTTPQGGSIGDYRVWAEQVPGVTRAWAYGSYYGIGTIVVFVMLDNSEAGNNGFPVGVNGVAALEYRDTPATGDQLAVANYILPLQPATALVYVVSPIQFVINLSISGIGSSYRAATSKAIQELFQTDTNSYPGGYVIYQKIWAAVASVTGNIDFIVTAPTMDIALPKGAIPFLGTITWSQ